MKASTLYSSFTQNIINRLQAMPNARPIILITENTLFFHKISESSFEIIFKHKVFYIKLLIAIFQFPFSNCYISIFIPFSNFSQGLQLLLLLPGSLLLLMQSTKLLFLLKQTSTSVYLFCMHNPVASYA